MKTIAWTLGSATLLCAAPVMAQQAPEPAPVTAEAFAGLAWLEGRWEGSGGGFDAFYEAFRLRGERAIEQTTYPDIGFSEPDGLSTIEFRDGEVVKVREGRIESVLTRLAGDTLRFDRVPPGRGGFFWIRVDDDTWHAILDRPSGDPVIYVMRRLEG